ncbi:ESX-1 secretion-associated protein [Mycolicibacterium llatzerense]|uniref:ESX-1 secretion-associated protein n=1 Tax=Mycolicibacterium llatzerense TaxID=280871 RepID=UPI0021B64613|nr:ESX-1 secretion-associated protein [Mycolicibacterium llatzerense]MCT7371922.1 hypothetical protein [Mycolicibacterium llatzerense]
MTSSNPYIRIHDGVLRTAAQNHQGAADYLQAIPTSTHPPIENFLSSLGPLFGDVRAAGLTVLDQRRADYESQARGHQQMTAGLHETAAAFQNHEEQAAKQLRGVIDT